VGQRIAYLHDYDMAIATHLVSGCDLWLNLPRPPFEASGTSGMKAALNGVLHLSVLDGWWVEGFEGANGWAIEGAVADDPEAQDDRHAEAFLDLVEHEVVPLFYERDSDGIPRRWMQMVKASIRAAGLRFTAQRMLGEYVARVYQVPAPAR
jgi:starch phosphorylase